MARSWTGGDASTRIASTTVRWANNDPALTAKTVDLGSPDALSRQPNPALVVIVSNPSTETDLTCEVQVKDVDAGGTTRWPALTSLTATRANGDGQAFLVDAGLVAAGGRVSLKNPTVIGAAGTFSAYVAVYAF